jgi:hypothetical protein
MIHISSSVVLGPLGDAIDARNPRIGWHNLVTPDAVTADEEADNEPAVNIANPATYLRWRGTTTNEQSVQLTLPVAQDVNYFAIAKHNLGSTAATLRFQSSTDGSTWSDVTSAIVLNTDYAVIYEFDSVFARYFRLLITPGSAPPSIAVWYVGQILVLQRRIYVGHTPLPYGRKTTVSTGRSESGEFLGRVHRRTFLESSVDLQNITPTWYRQFFEPFAQAAITRPFFWCWRPASYPDECGYAWLTDDIKMQNARANGMVSVSFSMQGIR